jgi:hypothetical protein
VIVAAVAVMDMSDSPILSEKSNAMLARFPGPVVIRPSKWKMLALFSPVYLLAAAGIWNFWSFQLQPKEWLVIGGIFGGGLLLPVTLTVISFVKDMPRITLDFQGFLLANPRGIVSGWNWPEVTSFHSTVGFVAFIDGSPPDNFLERIIDRFLRLPALRTFPSLYEFKAKDISRLMTAWRERALEMP